MAPQTKEPASRLSVTAPAGFRGQWLRPADEAYDAAARMFSSRTERRPGVIARCTCALDVVLALAVARGRRAEVSVLGAGNSVAGWSTNEGGLVLDLRPMNEVTVDPGSATCWFGGGATAGEVFDAAVAHGLVPVSGSVGTIGMASLASGAGEGYLTPRYGLASDQVLAAELVTADGDLLEVSAETNPELFWAIRGAGSCLGVITRMQIRLHPLPAAGVAGAVAYSDRHLAESLRAVWEVFLHGSASSWPFAYYGNSDLPGSSLQVYLGQVVYPDVDGGEDEQLRRLPGLTSDTSETTSYADMQRYFDDYLPFGGREYWDAWLFPADGDPDLAVELLLDLKPLIVRPDLSPTSRLILWRTADPGPPSIASVAPRTPGVSVVVCASWSDPEDDARHLDWVEEISAVLRGSGQVCEGSAAIHHTSVADPARTRELFGADYRRLQGIKGAVDPIDLFHNCFNVPPPASPRSTPPTNRGEG